MILYWSYTCQDNKICQQVTGIKKKKKMTVTKTNTHLCMCPYTQLIWKLWGEKSSTVLCCVINKCYKWFCWNSGSIFPIYKLHIEFYFKQSDQIGLVLISTPQKDVPCWFFVVVVGFFGGFCLLLLLFWGGSLLSFNNWLTWCCTCFA